MANCIDPLDTIAYYLSEYDMDAFHKLNYDTQSAGFRDIAFKFGKGEGYLRRLRDEYDVVSNSHRRGQCNRPPRQRIIDTKNQLCNYSFEQLTEIVYSILSNTSMK